MTGPSPTQRQAAAFADLARLSVERSGREVKTDVDFNKDKASADPTSIRTSGPPPPSRFEAQINTIEAEITDPARLASEPLHRRQPPPPRPIATP